MSYSKHTPKPGEIWHLSDQEAKCAWFLILEVISGPEVDVHTFNVLGKEAIRVKVLNEHGEILNPPFVPGNSWIDWEKWSDD